MTFLVDSIGTWKAKYTELHEQVRCTGLDHLIADLERVTQLGGEGLMLRQPGSTYERTRSTTLLKVKKFLDAEAVVTGYEAGLGRHKGRVGALAVRFGNGKELKVGTGLKDRERENPPVMGSIINVKYQELTKDGIPRFPVYVGVRVDGRPSDVPPARSKEKTVSLGSVQTGGTTMAATSKRYSSSWMTHPASFGKSGWTATMTTQWGRIGTSGQTRRRRSRTRRRRKRSTTTARGENREGLHEKRARHECGCSPQSHNDQPQGLSKRTG